MDSAEPFVFLQRYRLAICEKCGVAVLAKEVTTHLRERHRDVPVPRRQQIAAIIEGWPNIIQDQAGLVGFLYPPPTSSYIPQLAPPQTDGRKCRKCPYIARQLQKIQAHCRKYHGWMNDRGPGRPSLKRKRQPADAPETPVELPWTENIACQRFFRSRNASGWFEIDRKSLPVWAHRLYAPRKREVVASLATTPQPKKLSAADTMAQRHIEAVLQRHDRHVQTQNQPRVYAKALGEGSLAATSPWLERTQWLMMYKNVRRDILKAMTMNTRRPWGDLHLGQGEHEGDADLISLSHREQKIACILDAVDLMINRCETTARHTSRLIRCWLITSRSNSHQSRAFSVMTERNTQSKYRMMWKKFIAFIMRACFLSEPAQKQVKLEVPSDVRRQTILLWEHRVWDTIDITHGHWPNMTDHRYHADARPSAAEIESPRVFEPPEGQQNQIDESLTKSDSDSGNEDDSSDESDWEPDRLDDELGEVTEDEESHPIDGYQAQATNSNQDSTMIEFLELLFQLSITLIKQEFLDGNPGSTLLVYFSGIFGFAPNYQQFMLARQFCPALSGLIYVQRLLFLEWSLPLFSYHCIGLQQRPRFGQLEVLKRTCDRYIVAGSPSALAELFSLRSFGYKVSKTEAPAFLLHWSNNDNTVSCAPGLTLSMDGFRQLPEHFIASAEKLGTDLMYGFEPNVVLSRLKDDMVNSKPGYSFVSDPANGLGHGHAQLLSHACSRHGSLSALSGHGSWNWYAVRQYLKLTTKLEEMLFGGLYTSCGQAPRLREIVSLECENTSTGMRGIYVWNGSVIYIIRHHKAKRTTNHEFNVVRFLPARLGVVTVWYLAYIRRVASILQCELNKHIGQVNAAEDNLHLLTIRFLPPQTRQPTHIKTYKRRIIEYFKILLSFLLI